MSSGRQLGAQRVRSLTRARLVRFINSIQDTCSLPGKLSTTWNHVPESRGSFPFQRHRLTKCSVYVNASECKVSMWAGRAMWRRAEVSHRPSHRHLGPATRWRYSSLRYRHSSAPGTHTRMQSCVSPKELFSRLNTGMSALPPSTSFSK